MTTDTRSLDLALIGNGRIGALVDERATIVWCCFPRFDGDPLFCALLDTAPQAEGRGLWSIELLDIVEAMAAMRAQPELPNARPVLLSVTEWKRTLHQLASDGSLAANSHTVGLRSRDGP